ncbi:GNAT family N-acetyltransferase [Kineococcus sp. R8]|uniref:GNAT family N-acetyltransferase n=1 Tax=Kineococcus siccus TaxID=2696567 RepID=UPI00196A4059|nr:GNAT family N-acetyltransferase [Kineococcus siccus]
MPASPARSDLRHVTTPRLRLDAVTAADVDELHAVHADPRTWEHLPSGRHTRRSDTEQLVLRFVGDWSVHGLGYWAVRDLADPAGAAAPVLGVGGCARRRADDGRVLAWNVYYRLAPRAWGSGWAGELTTAARAAAGAVDPALPVVAYLLEHNHASRRTAERSGLQQVWRGPDAGNPDPAAVRLVYADRPLAPALLEELTAR